MAYDDAPWPPETPPPAPPSGEGVLLFLLAALAFLLLVLPITPSGLGDIVRAFAPPHPAPR